MLHKYSLCATSTSRQSASSTPGSGCPTATISSRCFSPASNASARRRSSRRAGPMSIAGRTRLSSSSMRPRLTGGPDRHDGRRGWARPIIRWYRSPRASGNALAPESPREFPRECRRHVHQIGKRVGPHLSHHLPSVSLHGDLADAELPRDLFVQAPGDHQRHDFALAAAQGRVPLAKLAHVRGKTGGGSASLDRVINGAQQLVADEWLRQELHGARLHGANGRWDVTVAGYENDRHVDPIVGDALLQLEAIEIRQRDVEDEAAGNGDTGPHEERRR